MERTGIFLQLITKIVEVEYRFNGYILFYTLRGKGRILQKGGLSRGTKCRRNYSQRSGGCRGFGGCQRPMTTCSWNDWFNFLSLLIPLCSFFILSLFLSPSLFFFLVGGGLQPPQSPLPMPLSPSSDSFSKGS